MSSEENPIISKLFFNFVGGLALALGILGIFLPLLPTTPFLLLASACFMRGSERFHCWLHQHPHLGPILYNWQQHRAVSANVKKRGYWLLAISLSFSLLTLPYWWLKCALLVGFIGLFYFFSRLPVHEFDVNS